MLCLHKKEAFSQRTDFILIIAFLVSQYWTNSPKQELGLPYYTKLWLYLGCDTTEVASNIYQQNRQHLGV